MCEDASTLRMEDHLSAIWTNSNGLRSKTQTKTDENAGTLYNYMTYLREKYGGLGRFRFLLFYNILSYFIILKQHIHDSIVTKIGI